MSDAWLVTRYCKVVPSFLPKINPEEDAIDKCSFHALLIVDGTRVFKERGEAVKYARERNYVLKHGDTIDISPYTAYGVTPLKIDDNGAIAPGEGTAWIETDGTDSDKGDDP